MNKKRCWLVCIRTWVFTF